MSRNKKIVLLIIIILGFVLPFSDYFVIFELFFMIYLFIGVFLLSILILIFGLIAKNSNNRSVLYVFFLLPIFILSQFVSTFAVKHIQKVRCNTIILEIEEVKNENGYYPNDYTIFGGILYTKIENKDQFVLKYSRGFMVTERYYSETKTWINIQ